MYLGKVSTLGKLFTVFLISKSVTRYSLIKVYGTDSIWRHFTSRTKQTRSDLYPVHDALQSSGYVY